MLKFLARIIHNKSTKLEDLIQEELIPFLDEYGASVVLIDDITDAYIEGSSFSTIFDSLVN